MYFVESEKMLVSYRGIIFSCCAVLLCSAHASCAQETRLPRPVPNVSHAHVVTNTSHLALDGSATAGKHSASTPGRGVDKLPLPSDRVTQPATVMFRDGKLTVEANNSNLTQILRDLANISGMTINGLDKGPRIFGVYGPGNSRDVLTDLLLGSGYNFIMVGGAIDGTPRELLLTSQNDNAPAIAPVNPTKVPSSDRDEPQQPELEMNPSVPNELGPGAIAPVPSLDEQDDSTRAQTTLQRLQQIHDQLQQSQPQ